MKTLVIDRRRWLCEGHMGDECDAALYSRVNKKMCCLGFLARKCGATVETIRNQPDPEATWDTVKWPAGTFDENGDHSTVISQVMHCNDEMLDDEKREEEVAKRLAELGYKVKFVGRYPKDGK